MSAPGGAGVEPVDQLGEFFGGGGEPVRWTSVFAGFGGLGREAGRDRLGALEADRAARLPRAWLAPAKELGSSVWCCGERDSGVGVEAGAARGAAVDASWIACDGAGAAELRGDDGEQWMGYRAEFERADVGLGVSPDPVKVEAGGADRGTGIDRGACGREVEVAGRCVDEERVAVDVAVRAGPAATADQRVSDHVRG